MSNVIQLPVIAGVQIVTDSEGRFNLNALHKASGGKDAKRPKAWLATKAAQELVDELRQDPAFGLNVTKVQRGGVSPGTFAHELLAVSYASWISPAFHLKVNQVFIDYRQGKLKPAAMDPTKLSRLDILSLAIEAEEENQKLTAQVAEMSPKVEALDRIATGAEGSMCITDAAKHLQVRPKDLFKYLQSHDWIYRRQGSSWLGYQEKVKQNLVEHKITTISLPDGSERITTQVRLTAKGLAKLSEQYEGIAS